MGYYGIFLRLKYNNTLSVIQRLDAQDYTEDETVTIKVPLSVPYYGDTRYERVDGEMEFEGQFYRLVKQKYERDTLYIVCIRDTKAEHIHSVINDYVNTFTDQAAERSSSKTIQSFIKDYCPSSFKLDSQAAGWTLEISFPGVVASIADTFATLHTPPPKV